MTSPSPTHEEMARNLPLYTFGRGEQFGLRINPMLDDESYNAIAQALSTTAKEARADYEVLEMKYRKQLWLNHGHSGQYGDDGEMQCSECMKFGLWDYKREPLSKLEEVVVAAKANAIRGGGA